MYVLLAGSSQSEWATNVNKTVEVTGPVVAHTCKQPCLPRANASRGRCHVILRRCDRCPVVPASSADDSSCWPSGRMVSRHIKLSKEALVADVERAVEADGSRGAGA